MRRSKSNLDVIVSEATRRYQNAAGAAANAASELHRNAAGAVAVELRCSITMPLQLAI